MSFPLKQVSSFYPVGGDIFGALRNAFPGMCDSLNDLNHELAVAQPDIQLFDYEEFPNPAPQFLAIEEQTADVALGMLSYRAYPNADEPHALAYDYCVSLTHRGRGIGTALMTTAIDTALSSGFPYLRTVTLARSECTRDFLRKLGFVAIKEKQQHTLFQKAL